MEWQDQGAVLSVRRHGETSAIVEIFTEEHGRHAGVVRGATSRKIAPTLQPGTQVAASWRARLEDHLGAFTLEPIKSRAASVMSGRLELAGLNAITSLLSFALPEREAHAPLYHRSIALLDLLGENEAWPLAYLHWELALLEEMGFGLDLSRCAVTGASEGLCYISPKSGRAVSMTRASKWCSNGFSPDAHRCRSAFAVPPVTTGRPAPLTGSWIAARQRTRLLPLDRGRRVWWRRCFRS